MPVQGQQLKPPDPRREQPLPCPGCGNDLRQVYAEAHYGRYLLLDQCPGCGGIWFDHWELYYLKDGEANRLDPVDQEKLLALTAFQKGPHLCPRCQKDLEPFRDPNLPEDTKIERCPGCNGLWLNRGELQKYIDYKTTLRKRRGDRPQPRPNQPLHPSLDDQNKKLEALKNLGQVLSTRVTPEIGGLSAMDETEMDRSELAKDLVFIILQTLLRLILKI